MRARCLLSVFVFVFLQCLSLRLNEELMKSEGKKGGRESGRGGNVGGGNDMLGKST